MRLKNLHIFGVLAAIGFAPAALAQYDLGWYTFDGGGAIFSTGGSFELGGTIGQPDAGGALTGGSFDLVGGFWTIPAAAPVCHGDCNCDGTVNFADINAFVNVLSGGTPCTFANCDINGDGLINFDDINPFVAILSGGGGPCP
jgi:hypothetical protein